MAALSELEDKASHLDKGKWLLVVIGVVTLVVVYRAYKDKTPAVVGVPTAASRGTIDAQTPQQAPQQPPTVTGGSPASGSSMPDYAGILGGLQAYSGFVNSLENVVSGNSTSSSPAGGSATPGSNSTYNTPGLNVITPAVYAPGPGFNLITPTQYSGYSFVDSSGGVNIYQNNVTGATMYQKRPR